MVTIVLYYNEHKDLGIDRSIILKMNIGKADGGNAD
jgi:hypothetical protein